MIHINTNNLWFTEPNSYNIYLSKNYLVLDCETTNIDKGNASNPDNELVLVTWEIHRPDGTVVRKYKFGDEYNQHELLADIQTVDFIVAHNAKFELKWLRRCGLDLTKVKVFCTMLAQWVINGNLKTPGLSLDSCAVHYGLHVSKNSYVSNLIKRGCCPSQIPKGKLLKYCALDTKIAGQLLQHQIRLLGNRHILHIALTRFLTCQVLADIEFEGMTLDKDRVNEEYLTTVRTLQITKAELELMAPGVNLNSPKQLAEFLYDTLGFKEPRDNKGNPVRTKTGQRSADSDTLGKLSAITEQQKQFLELYKKYNKLSSLLSKNLEFFKGVVDNYEDCTFRAQFNQGITKTHRLSSSGVPLTFPGSKKPKSVQFQNLPRQLKRVFSAGTSVTGIGDEPLLIGEVDGASLEFRVAADLGRDRIAINEIEQWADIHSVTAATLSAAGEPTTRQQAKASTFAPLYGGMGKTVAQRAYAEFFKRKYAGISRTQSDWANKVLDNKELRTPYGMIYYWPECSRSSKGYISNTTEIYNFPVQGFATAEIIPIALVHFWFRSKAYDSRITVINTVHDSIITKFPKSKEEEFRSLATQALTTDVYNYLRNNYHYEFVCPLGVGIKVAPHWGDTKQETKTNVWPDGRMETKEDA